MGGFISAVKSAEWIHLSEICWVDSSQWNLLEGFVTTVRYSGWIPSVQVKSVCNGLFNGWPSENLQWLKFLKFWVLFWLEDKMYNKRPAFSCCWWYKPIRLGKTTNSSSQVQGIKHHFTLVLVSQIMNKCHFATATVIADLVFLLL